jgi:hypothetical protein
MIRSFEETNDDNMYLRWTCGRFAAVRDDLAEFSVIAGGTHLGTSHGIRGRGCRGFEASGGSSSR